MKRATFVFSLIFLSSCGGGGSSDTNSSPFVNNVIVTDINGGDLKIGDVLTGDYIYGDAEGDPEGNSSLQWLKDGTPISGATSTQYTVTSNDLPSSIQFRVTPRATSGNTQGSPEVSSAITLDRYSKMNEVGLILPDNATEWHCVRDNVTSLIWEVKTNDGGLYDRDNTYRWGGIGSIGASVHSFTDWDLLVNGANNNSLCGYNLGWRVPFIDELFSLVTETRRNSSQIPAMNLDYFPNSQPWVYWSVNADTTFSSHGVTFNYGDYSSNGGDGAYHVRIVRSDL